MFVVDEDRRNCSLTSLLREVRLYLRAVVTLIELDDRGFYIWEIGCKEALDPLTIRTPTLRKDYDLIIRDGIVYQLLRLIFVNLGRRIRRRRH